MIQSVGSDKKTGASNFNSVIEKINNTQRKWKVLEDNEEGGDEINDGVRIGNDD